MEVLLGKQNKCFKLTCPERVFSWLFLAETACITIHRTWIYVVIISSASALSSSSHYYYHCHFTILFVISVINMTEQIWKKWLPWWKRMFECSCRSVCVCVCVCVCKLTVIQVNLAANQRELQRSVIFFSSLEVGRTPTIQCTRLQRWSMILKLQASWSWMSLSENEMKVMSDSKLCFLCHNYVLTSPWFNHNGWLGIKHQATYLLSSPHVGGQRMASDLEVVPAAKAARLKIINYCPWTPLLRTVHLSLHWC